MIPSVPPRWRTVVWGVQYLFWIGVTACFMAGAFSGFLAGDAFQALVLGFAAGVNFMVACVSFMGLVAASHGEAS